VYAWPLRQRLPAIPVPLAGADADVTLDLKAVFDTVYERAGYDYSLDYDHAVEPAVGEAEAGWVREVLTTG